MVTRISLLRCIVGLTVVAPCPVGASIIYVDAMMFSESIPQHPVDRPGSAPKLPFSLPSGIYTSGRSQSKALAHDDDGKMGIELMELAMNGAEG